MTSESDDDDDVPSTRQKVCVDCGTLSPITDSSFTLISSRFGWRLTRSVDAAGEPTIEWRCPDCWTKFKRRPSRAPKKL